MNLLIEVLAFAVAIGVLVVVHEYGHYSVARLCGVKVLRFSIGFGKPILQWVSKKTGTQWTIAWLPLGGYVKMLDEREEGAPIAKEELRYAFNRQSVGKRFAIVAAGPVANFLLAIVLFGAVFATGVTEPAAKRSLRCATRARRKPTGCGRGPICAGSCLVPRSIIATSYCPRRTRTARSTSR
jgi:regulator of sigma E protease